MKTYNKTFLPENIEYKGEIYTLNLAIQIGIDRNETSIKTISQSLKKEGRKCLIVNVLSKNLKGKKDLFNNPYKPNKYIFTT